MAHKIREFLIEKDFQLEGTIEMDESLIGGRKNKKKFYIFGMRERGKNGRMKIFVVNDRPRDTELIPIIKKHVKAGSTIYTDKYWAYQDLKEHGYNHKSISHKKTYAAGKIHTNSIEVIWSHIKGSIFGTHRQVSKKWLQNYVNEYTYNYNRKNREISFDELFD